MSMTIEQLLAEAMTLDPRDREALAEQILLTLGPDEQAEIDAAWLAEAHRREALPNARQTSSTVDEVVSRIRARARR